MTPFNRRSFQKAKINKIFSRARSTPSYLSNILPESLNTQAFQNEVGQLTYFVDLVLGGHASKVLLAKNPDVVLWCSQVIYQNFSRQSANPKVQDLQLTLAVNLIMSVIKTTPLPSAAVDGAADGLLKDCSFPSDFKLEIRQQLFDNQLIDKPFMKVIYYP